MTAVAERPTSDSPVFAWTRGSELRNSSGLYGWSMTTGPQVSPDTEWYPSVTTSLDATTGGMVEARQRFIGQAVTALGLTAKRRENVEIWHKGLQMMVPVNPVDIICNSLPVVPAGFSGWVNGDTVYWPKGHGENYIVSAADRELARRANRGQIIHDLMEDRARLFTRREPAPATFESGGLREYIAQLIADRDFAITVDYCAAHAIAALQYFDANVEEVLLFEAPVFNRTYCYAGTLDLIVRLKGRPGIWCIDIKTGKNWYPSYWYQLSAYRNAEFVPIALTGFTMPMPVCDHMASLMVSEQPDGSVIASLKEWDIWHQRGVDAAGAPIMVDRGFELFLEARDLWQGQEDCKPPETRRDVKPGKVIKPDPALLTVPRKMKSKLELTLAEGE